MAGDGTLILIAALLIGAYVVYKYLSNPQTNPLTAPFYNAGAIVSGWVNGAAQYFGGVSNNVAPLPAGMSPPPAPTAAQTAAASAQGPTTAVSNNAYGVSSSVIWLNQTNG